MKHNAKPTEPESARRRPGRWGLAAMAAVWLAALLARGLYLREQVERPDFYHPEVDAAYHDVWARALVSGDWTPPPGRPDPEIQRRAYFRPPGYPFFLAAVYKFLGPDYLAPRVVQMMLGLVNAGLAFLLARRWFGRLAGLLAAAFMGLYWGFVYFEGELLEPVLLITLSLLFLLVLGSGGRRAGWRAFAAGVLLGLSALVRPNGLLLAPAVVLWMAWRARRAGTAKAWRRPALAFCAGLGAAIAPAAVRNATVAGDPVLISSNAGINLYIGNHPGAGGVVQFYLPGLGVFGTSFDYPAIARAVEARAGKPMKDSAVSRYFTGEALRFIRREPARFLRLLGRKTLLFWGPYELGHNKEDDIERRRSPVLRRLPGSFPLALALAAVGLFTLRRRTLDPGAYGVVVLMLLYIGAVFFSHLPFFIAGRYRLPAVPFLLILGAAGAARVIEGWRAGARREAGRAALLGVAVFVLASIHYTGYRPSPAKWAYEQSLAMRKAGREAEADALFRQAAVEDPAFLHALYHNLGMGLADQQRLDEALGYLEAALRYKPSEPDTLSSLGAVLFSVGRTEEALSHFAEALRVNPAHRDARMNMAFILTEQGRTDEAIGQYEQLLAEKEDDAKAHGQLALALSRAGRREEALEHQAAALRLDPGNAQGHSNLAALYAELGRPAEALRHFEEATRLNPALWDAWFGAGVVLARQGVWADSIEMMNRAARERPEDLQPYFYIAGALARLNRLDEALLHYREALLAYSNYVPWLAEAAWTLATHPLARDEQVEAAAAWADTAARLTDYRDPQVLDAWAAALARSGEYTQAVAQAETGAVFADRAGRTNIAAGLRTRLEDYRAGRPFME